MNTTLLKQKILDLAIKGKLIEQDLSETPIDVPAFDGDKPFEIPQNWVWAELSDICSVITDGTHQTPEYTDDSVNGFKFLSSRNVTKGVIDWENIMYIPKHLHEILYKRLAPQKGDILLAKNGTTGYSAIVDTDCIFDIYVSLALIRPITEIVNAEFLCTIMDCNLIQNHFKQNLKGIGVPNLHLKHIRTALTPLPPLAEQKRIVDIVQKLFAEIDKLEQNKIELKDLIKIAKQKVLDLAIKGKLTEQDLSETPIDVPAFDANKPFEIPQNWVWSTIKDICKVKGGKRIPKGTSFSTIPTEHIYLRVTDMKNNTIIDDDIKCISEEIYEKISNYTISSNDLYMTVAGTIGQVGTIPLKYDGMNLTENANKLTEIIIDKDFLCKAIQSDFIQNQLLWKVTQVSQPKLAIERINTTVIPLPPIAEQKRIVAKVEALFSQLDKIETELE